MNRIVIPRWLGCCDYSSVWQRMKDFTAERGAETNDELWLLEHPPVFTQGLAGKPEHVLNPGDIPIIQTDRGGQVTYHGPGQLVAYALFDLRRLEIGVRQLVRSLEQAVIDVLADYGVAAHNRIDAPGVYVDGAKICSIGLRVRKGCSYHGIAFNITADLAPFARINPCGFRNLTVTRLAHFVPQISVDAVWPRMVEHIAANFGYTTVA